MRIHVVNPNTSEAMTETIRRAAAAVAGPGVEVLTTCPSMGPASIESHYDEALSVPGLLAEIASAPADGHVIACFGDPGLDAARELADGPVIGIAEAAMRTAACLGRGFSVVTTLDRTCGRAWDLAHRYGMAGLCRGVSACDVPVLEVEAAVDAVVAACRTAVVADRSDVVVLGCAGMTAQRAEIERRVGVPVVDGVQAAVLQVESLVRMGLRTSAVGEFASPPPKPYAGVLEAFGASPVRHRAGRIR
ncbi:aspartate/glutamate racemase family protein [Lentzea cavernae]|uniref:Asp/Glu racemase n=1 Tax=Lentzea cavernae TaxID=2020703 RepID=A0ABQ3M7H4_9PSEU|nr:aspartate/glutamate racemase family protein [Lentzea cavernae]GHH35009.1 putative Asp/Glu racemase [Lentzea cavernae]